MTKNHRQNDKQMVTTAGDLTKYYLECKCGAIDEVKRGIGFAGYFTCSRCNTLFITKGNDRRSKKKDYDDYIPKY